MLQLAKSQNVAKMISFQAPNILVFEMDWTVNVKQFIAKQMETEKNAGLQYALHLIKAAAHLNKMRIIHTQISIDNVFIDSATCTLKLFDFSQALITTAGKMLNKCNQCLFSLSPIILSIYNQNRKMILKLCVAKACTLRHHPDSCFRKNCAKSACWLFFRNIEFLFCPNNHKH